MRWEISVPSNQCVPWATPPHTPPVSITTLPTYLHTQNPPGAPIKPQGQPPCKFTPVTLMFLSLGQKPRCGILGCWERRRGGEQGSVRVFGPPHCLSRLCVWTACKNYATSNISFTSKRFWKSSPSSEAELPCASPTLVLNQAFICLPIGTDAKCP